LTALEKSKARMRFLHRALKAATRARISRPIEHSLQFGHVVVRRVAKQRAFIHPRRIDDLA